MPLIKRGSAPVAETTTSGPGVVVTRLDGPVAEGAVALGKTPPVATPASSTEMMAPSLVAETPKVAKAAPSYSDAKDRRISRQGLYQAALQSQALMQYCPTLDDYLAMVERVAEKGLEFVGEGA